MEGFEESDKKGEFPKLITVSVLVTDHHKYSDLFGKTLLWTYAALE